MIKCYFTKETLDRINKSPRRDGFGCACCWYGVLASFLIMGFAIAPKNVPSFGTIVFFAIIYGVLVFVPYFFYRGLLHIKEITFQHAGDEITLDDNEIRLVNADETQIVFPRDGLQIQRTYKMNHTMIFEIKNDRIDSDIEIVLTTDMENAKELAEAIQPGLFEYLREIDSRDNGCGGD
jgi:hypothetical protein